MSEYTGKISINRATSNFEPDSIHIRLIDEASDMVVTDIKMSVEAFGFAITGLSMQACLFDVIASPHAEKIGKTRVMKNEYVYLGGNNPINDHARIIAKARELELDGWVCNLNKHQRIIVEKAGLLWKISVPFVRWVDVVDEANHE